MNKKSFTMADRRSSRFHISGIESIAFTMGATHVNRLYLQRIAFTMAEILLSLAIIGVVAAITLPSLTGNINERTWDTQRRALYARISQAIALMGSLNGYGLNAPPVRDNAAKIFINEGLGKVLKINNICDYSNLSKCGISSNVKKNDGTTINFPIFIGDLLGYNPINDAGMYDTKVAAFETANGESVAVFYNPICKTDILDYANAIIYSDDTPGAKNTFPCLCVNFVYDLNGKKGPNTYGKDIGSISVFNPTDSFVVGGVLDGISYSSLPYKTFEDAFTYCKSLGEGYRLPTITEWMGIAVNNLFLNLSVTRYWSSQQKDIDNAYAMYPAYGIRRHFPKSTTFKVKCIKR